MADLPNGTILRQNPTLRDTPATGAWSRFALRLWGIRELMRRGRPNMVLHLVAGIGDELLCSCIMHELRHRNHRNVWLMTSHPDLFRHNPDSGQLLPPDLRYLGLAKRIGADVVEPRYTCRVSDDRDASPPRHVLRIMLATAGVRGRADLRPYLYLTDEERSAAAWATDSLIVQSSGQGAIFHNRLKEYPLARFQAVIDTVHRLLPVIQVGHRDDPLLRNVKDFRGKTSLRETAAALSRSRLFLGTEGGLMHVARAVDCRAVIIFGGRLWPEQTGYICNENIAMRPSCAPCWGWKVCDFDHVCMQDIAPAMVVKAVERALARVPGKLEVEAADITDADVWHPLVAP
jgi:hypothetical protein